MKKPLPIGFSDFRVMRQENLYYVDKTLLAQEVVESTKQVILLPRPRRFGKTLNLSMLRYFFDNQKDYSPLFEGLAITQTPYWASHHGEYPTLFLTLKDIITDSWDDMLIELGERLADLVANHKYLLTSEKVEKRWQNQLEQVYNAQAPTPILARSLMVLTHALEAHHGQRVVVLIDEYDSPILKGHQAGYYQKVVDFMRSMMAAVFKDNNSLYRGVVTGILRVAKESIFSGLNNLTTRTVLDAGFHTSFGLTTEEVRGILADFDRANEYETVAEWYNGYLFAGEEIYNPWSIIHYLDNPGALPQPYWVNTSGNELIKRLIRQASATVQEGLERLMQGKAVESPLQRFTVFKDLETPTDDILYAFLVFSGYLKAKWVRRDAADIDYYTLQIPNREVARIYRETFAQELQLILKESGSFKVFTESLLAPDWAHFEQLMKTYVLSAFSFHDLPPTYPERVYQGFVLGLLAHLSGTHFVKSNRESGYGRADVLLIPREAEDPRGYVLELKRAQEGQNLQATAQEALGQVARQAYTQELKDHGKTQLHRLAIAFRGKEVALAHSGLQR